jgi:hypothetical protein
MSTPAPAPVVTEPAPAPAPAAVVTDTTEIVNEPPSKFNKIGKQLMYAAVGLFVLIIFGIMFKNKEYQRDTGRIAVVGLTGLLISLIIDVTAFSKCEESKKFIKKPMYWGFLIFFLILGAASFMLKSRGTILAETVKKETNIAQQQNKNTKLKLQTLSKAGI